MSSIEKTPRNKSVIESKYFSILAPFAVKTGRRTDTSEEYDEDNRSMFQRDRDRIIHSKSFRRLMYKTQVYVNHEWDFFRTRLTHTLEVSQLARGMCKSLGLNEDLAEAISLGHDLGHTPFGHAAEDYFDKVLEGFKHNEQSVRVVDFLEKRREDKQGLNLTTQVLEGILKHTNRSSGLYPELAPGLPCSHLEGQIVKMMDTVAYVCHDLEDAIKSGLVDKIYNKNADIRREYKVIKEHIGSVAVKSDGSPIIIERNQFENAFFIRELIHFFVVDLTNTTFAAINELGIKSLDDIKSKAAEGIYIPKFSPGADELFEVLKKFVTSNIYQSQIVSIMDAKAVMVVQTLFDKFINNPKMLPPDWYFKHNNIDTSEKFSGIANGRTRVIVDYISGMTDRFAIEEYEKLTNPRTKFH